MDVHVTDAGASSPVIDVLGVPKKVYRFGQP